MALDLKLDICQSNDCRDLQLTETTGVYDASSNTGGYGAPNPEIADILSANVTLSLLDRTTGAPTVSPSGEISVFPGSADVTLGVLPNITSTVQTITGDNFGYGTSSKLVDGVYTLKYDVNTASKATSATKTFTVFLNCNIKCCEQKLGWNSQFGRDKNSKSYNDYMEVSHQVRAMEAARCCGRTQDFIAALEYAEKICNDCGCS